MPDLVTGADQTTDEVVDIEAGGTTEPTPGSPEAGQPDTGTQDVKKDLTDAVSAALLKTPEQASGSSKEKSEKDESTDKKVDDEGKVEGDATDEDLSPEDLQRLNAKTKKRITGLVGRVKTQGAEIERLKPLADNYEQMQSFVRGANLSGTDVNTGFEIMALMKNDPDAAYEKVLPIFIQLANMVGAGKLPDDIAADVERGIVPPERAREIARLRAREGLAKHRNTVRQTADTEQRQIQAQQEAAQRVASAITGWEVQWKKSDTDYAKKSGWVKDKFVAALTERTKKGEQITPESAVALLNEVRTAVETQMKSFLPPPRSQPGPSPLANNGRPPAAPKPKSFEDVIGQALRQ